MSENPSPQNPTVRITTSRGALTAVLYADAAPLTVKNFLELSADGFYDGLTFHRVIDDFMAQGGCPEGTGLGGPGHRVPDEFSDRRHLTGSLSMANDGSPNSGGSQFFICHRPLPHLDGKHSVFGRLTSGVDVLYKIGVGDVIERIETL